MSTIESVTIADALRLAQRLVSVSDTPRLDAELLLNQAAGVDRIACYTWPEKPIPTDQFQNYEQLIARRVQGEPIAHITGMREFWSLSLNVNSSTLIPRPDTERLVEAALSCIEAWPYSKLIDAQIMDLGTGSGAIALAIASEYSDVKLLAVDQSAQALAVAERNIEQLQLHNVRCEQASWLDTEWTNSLPPHSMDMIVSNPPYIDVNDPHLQEGDVRFEPQSALIAEDKGLSDIAAICPFAYRVLRPQGYLWLEHGWQQAKAVADCLSQAGFEKIQTFNDYGGNPRVTGGQKLSGL